MLHDLKYVIISFFLFFFQCSKQIKIKILYIFPLSPLLRDACKTFCRHPRSLRHIYIRDRRIKSTATIMVGIYLVSFNNYDIFRAHGHTKEPCTNTKTVYVWNWNPWIRHYNLRHNLLLRRFLDLHNDWKYQVNPYVAGVPLCSPVVRLHFSCVSGALLLPLFLMEFDKCLEGQRRQQESLMNYV